MKQREIKFRAWDCKQMHHFDLWWNHADYLNPEDVTVMQFTGLKDKNGVEIYENDLVQHPAWDYPFKVIFIQDSARFVCEMQTGLTQSIKGEILTVVGNVYQTPLK